MALKLKSNNTQGNPYHDEEGKFTSAEGELSHKENPFEQSKIPGFRELGDDWKNFIAGLKEWSASCEGNYAIHTDENGQQNLQDAYISGETVTVKLYVNDTNYYTGSAYVSSLSVEDPVDDVVSATFELKGTGELTFN